MSGLVLTNFFGFWQAGSCFVRFAAMGVLSELFEVGGGQVTPFSGWDVVGLKTPDADADEALEAVAQGFKHHADLAFVAGDEDDAEAAWGQAFDEFGLVFALIGVDA